MLGRQSAEDVRLPYSSVDMDGVEFRQETVTGIDPGARRVTTDAGSYDADFLVVAMGADYDVDATPGLQAGGFEYYTVAGAERLRDALADFDGGRVLVSVLGQPFKCPPAASRSAPSTWSRASIRLPVRRTWPMARRCPTTSSSGSRSTALLSRSRPRAWPSTAGCQSTRPTSGPSSHRSTRSAMSAPVPARCPKPASSPNRPHSSSPMTSPPRSPAQNHRRRTAARASVMPNSATGSSARSTSTSSAARQLRPSGTTPRASSPPRKCSSARPGGRAGSDCELPGALHLTAMRSPARVCCAPCGRGCGWSCLAGGRGGQLAGPLRRDQDAGGPPDVDAMTLLSLCATRGDAFQRVHGPVWRPGDAGADSP